MMGICSALLPTNDSGAQCPAVECFRLQRRCHLVISNLFWEGNLCNIVLLIMRIHSTIRDGNMMPVALAFWPRSPVKPATHWYRPPCEP